MKNDSVFRKIELWIHLYSEELTSLIVLIIIGVILFQIKMLPKCIRDLSLNELDSKSFAVIDSIERKEGIVESEMGGQVVVNSFFVKFYFIFDNEKVEVSETIIRNSLGFKERLIMNSLTEGDSINIKYDSKQIFKARINFE